MEQRCLLDHFPTGKEMCWMANIEETLGNLHYTHVTNGSVPHDVYIKMGEEATRWGVEVLSLCRDGWRTCLFKSLANRSLNEELSESLSQMLSNM